MLLVNGVRVSSIESREIVMDVHEMEGIIYTTRRGCLHNYVVPTCLRRWAPNLLGVEVSSFHFACAEEGSDDVFVHIAASWLFRYAKIR